MSKLLEKYNEFLRELDKAVSPLVEVVERENFNQEECHTIANFCAGAITIKRDVEHYKDAIAEVDQAIEFFSLEEGK